jgi:WD40 repeat protein
VTFNGFISYSHAADGRLAPALQRGLHRLAKPWYRRRALWIFRDQTGLAVTPGLWSAIQEGLDSSDWFVLMASPEAAESQWVNREIEHWIATKSAKRILPVVTGGQWSWDPARADFTEDSTAVPPALRGVFAEEPLFLDLRWARDDKHLNLRHSRFRDAIAQLAAPMHGLTKDDLEGEDVRQHRLVRRVWTVAVATVLTLGLVASLAGVFAVRNGQRASMSAAEASRNLRTAAQQKESADTFAREARLQEANAQKQEQRARDAAVETKRQEANAHKQAENARTQQELADRAAARSRTQEQIARQQREAAQRAAADAEQQRRLAQDQQKLAGEAASDADRQKRLAERQQRAAEQAAQDAQHQKRIADEQALLAKQSAEDARRQTELATEQRRLADEAAEEAQRQKGIAEQEQRKAEEAAEDARTQQANAEEQRRIAIGRRLMNEAKETMDDDPKTALMLGLAAQKVQPDAEARSELTGLVTSTRYAGTLDSVVRTVVPGRGGVVAVDNVDGTVSLWNVTDPRNPTLLSTIREGAWLQAQTFGPGGNTLVVIDRSGSRRVAVLWNVADRAHPVRLASFPRDRDISEVVFSPERGMFVTTNGTPGSAELWEMTDPARPKRLSTLTHPGYLGRAVFSPDGRTLVTRAATDIVWDVTDPAHPVQIATLDSSVLADGSLMEYSPTRPILATGDTKGTVIIWNMQDPAEPKRVAVLTHADTVRALAFNPAGDTLASADLRGTMTLWDVANSLEPYLKPVRLDSMVIRGGSIESMAFNADGRTLITASHGASATLWSVTAPGAPQKGGGLNDSADARNLAVAFSPDGLRALAARQDGTARFYDMDGDHARRRYSVIPIHNYFMIQSAAISADLRTVAAIGADDSRWTLTDVSDPNEPVSTAFDDPGSSVSAVAISPDGNTLAVANVANGGEDKMTLWDLTDRAHPSTLATLSEDVGWARSAAFSPDGRTVAVGRSDGAVTLWNVADPAHPTRQAALTSHSEFVNSVVFSPDGRTLATGSDDETTILWDIADRPRPRRVTVLTGQHAPVTSVAFSPDGRTLATASSAPAIASGGSRTILWDRADGPRPTRVATMVSNAVYEDWVGFSPNGHILAVSNVNYRDGGLVSLWNYTGLNDLRADPARSACAITGRGLTEDEWGRHLPELPYQNTCPG